MQAKDQFSKSLSLLKHFWLLYFVILSTLDNKFGAYTSEKLFEKLLILTKLPKMDIEEQKLLKDIQTLREEILNIQNSTTIPTCLKNIQIRLIAKLIGRIRDRLDILKDQKSIEKYHNVN